MIFTTTNITKYIVASITLLVLDILWIQIFMANKYKIMIPKIQNGIPLKMNYISAILAYIFMLVALNIFVISKKFTNIEAFIFGVCLYAVYDFTAGAILKNWNFHLAIIDILWGGIVFMSANFIANLL